MHGPSLPRHRLFFALLPEAAVRERLQRAAQRLISEHAPGGRPTPGERLHLTLAFLGEFPATNTDVGERALRVGATVAAPAFELVLDAALSFPARRPPWVLRPGAHAALMPLLDSLGAALRGSDFRWPLEDQFLPHVTVLRDAAKALAPVAIAPIRWPVADFALIDSRPGPQYSVLRRWSLAAAARG